MQSKSERMASRLDYKPGDVALSTTTYNLIIGLVLFYGFIVNYVMVSFFYEPILRLFSNPMLFFIAYVVCIIVGTLLIFKSDVPAISFLGYNLIVIPLGCCVSVVVGTLGAAGYNSIISTAFVITAIITALMILLSSIFEDFFLSIGRVLFVTLLVTIVVSFIFYFAGANLAILDYVFVLIFCGYIGYDWAKANRCAKTVDNAIDSASELYIDIIILFLRLIRILSRSNRS